MATARRTKAAQREATVRALLDEARAAFSAHGYRNASVAAIADAARVTKGAVYHHFRGGKPDLFHAVVAELHAEVGARVAGAAPDGDPWTQLLAGCRAFLEATSAPDTRRILLIDAPAILGWDAWRALDAESSARHLEEALVALRDDGTIEALPLRPLVHLLSGAMNEAALALAGAPDRERSLDDTVIVLERLLSALRRSG